MKRYLCAVFLSLISALSAAAAVVPVTIDSASIDYTAHTITVFGQGFCAGGLPSIVFNTTKLKVVSSCSSTEIVASLPVQTAGSYRLLITNSSNVSATFEVTYGAVGPQGITGSEGPQGPTGKTGAAGPQGATGAAGPIGPQGPMGLTGATGAIGAQGAQGLPGANGTSVTTLVVPPGNPSCPTGGVALTSSSGVTYICNGASGTTGAQGLPGATGATGPQGLTGATGTAGPIGLTGASGPIGPQGPQGVQGPQGAAGTNGTGFSFRGVFNSSTAYAINDVVTYAPAAGNITYNVNLTFGSTGSMVGTITTDGTIGVLNTSNIVSWSLTLADSATNSTLLTPGNSAFSSGNYNTGGQPNNDFTATSTNLTMTYSGGGFWGVSGASGQFCMTDWSNCFGPIAYGTWSINGDNAYSYSGAAGSQVIGTGGTVATPVTSTYVAAAPVAAGSAIPGTSPWVMMAQGGAAGAVGAAGATGAQGPVGPAGASIQGPAGPSGPTGPQGPAGATGGVLSYAFGNFPTSMPLDTGAMQAIGSVTLQNAGTYLVLGQALIQNTNSTPVSATCALYDTNAAWQSYPSSSLVTYNAQIGSGFQTIPIQGLVQTSSGGDSLVLQCEALPAETNVITPTASITVIQVK